MRAPLALVAAVVAVGCARGATLGGSARRESPRPAAPGDRADLLVREGKPGEAVEAYAAAVAERPQDVRTHLRYVEALLALGRRREAREIYQARAASPEATEVDRVMVARLSTNGASTPLRRVYAAAAEQSPDVPWWRLGVAEVEIAEADAWNRRRLDAIERGDRREERKAATQARAALGRGDRAVDQAAALAPTLAEIDLYRGMLRAVEGDLLPGATAKAAAYRAAAEAFERAVTRDPTLGQAWEGLGDVLYRNGDVRESLEAWLEATRLAPADPHVRKSLGIVLHEVERYGEASAQYLEAARLDPRDGDVWLRLGDVRADDERWEPALEAYAEALVRDGRVVEAHRKAGRVLEQLGRFAEAREAYERYVAADGPDAEAVKRRVERLLRAERTEAAGR